MEDVDIFFTSFLEYLDTLACLHNYVIKTGNENAILQWLSRMRISKSIFVTKFICIALIIQPKQDFLACWRMDYLEMK